MDRIDPSPLGGTVSSRFALDDVSPTAMDYFKDYAITNGSLEEGE